MVFQGCYQTESSVHTCPVLSCNTPLKIEAGGMSIILHGGLNADISITWLNKLWSWWRSWLLLVQIVDVGVPASTRTCHVYCVICVLVNASYTHKLPLSKYSQYNHQEHNRYIESNCLCWPQLYSLDRVVRWTECGKAAGRVAEYKSRHVYIAAREFYLLYSGCTHTYVTTYAWYVSQIVFGTRLIIPNIIGLKMVCRISVLAFLFKYQVGYVVLSLNYIYTPAKQIAHRTAHISEMIHQLVMVPASREVVKG